ncbi:PBP1A family penicillin-binding protein [Enterococcus bulliens]
MANESRTSRRQTTKRPTSKPSKKKKTKKHIWRNLILGGIFAVCLLFLIGIGIFGFYAKNAPALEDNKLDATVSSKLYSSNGENFIDIGSENREKISATEVPELLEDAIVSIEDRRFYKHIGIDPIRIVGSAINNIFHGTKQGGSTLTQQLIKLSYFSTNESDQTLKRKAQEAWLSIQLERKKSKQEILTYYINKVYMANGLYGMETASEAYYGKSLDKLSLAQTALLAGLPNAPSYYDPYVNKEAAKQRRDLVLKAMLDNDKISESQYQEAVATDISDGLKPLDTENSEWKYYDNYITEVSAEIKEKTGKDLYTDGLEVYTNLDLDAQKKLYDIANTQEYVDYPDDEMQIASTVIDVDSGKVVAQLGGRNRQVGDQNLAINTARDFGSTVKPITDYAPAFEHLHYSTGKYIADAPYDYEGSDIAVNNWDNSYMGNITLRTALSESRNVPAAKLFMEVGASDVEKFLKSLDIQYEDLTQANAISSNTKQDGTKYGVSSLKMAAAYAAFANGGTYYEPQYVNKIVYQDGTQETFESKGVRVMQPGTAYMITDILKDVITGLGNNAAIEGLYQAGKTGTSNYTEEQLAKVDAPYGLSVYPDTTFVGFTPHYSMAVWIGYLDPLTPVTNLSSHVATDVYRELMSYISASFDTQEDFVQPDDVVRVGNELYFKDSYSSSNTQNNTTKNNATTKQSSKEEIPASTSKTKETSSTTIESSSSVPEVSASISSEESQSSEVSKETTPSQEELPTSSETPATPQNNANGNTNANNAQTGNGQTGNGQTGNGQAGNGQAGNGQAGNGQSNTP